MHFCIFVHILHFEHILHYWHILHILHHFACFACFAYFTYFATGRRNLWLSISKLTAVVVVAMVVVYKNIFMVRQKRKTCQMPDKKMVLQDISFP